jgi:hypothetical protein
LVSQEQEKANEFLRPHKTDQPFFTKDTIIFFYDNGVVSPEYEIAELKELLQGTAMRSFSKR